MSGPTEVNFRTYCTVFNATGNQDAVKQICPEIFGEVDGAWRTATQNLYQDKVGDGMAQFPRPGDVPNGIRQWYDFKYWNYLNDDPLKAMTRAVFLAGAFGIKEIPLKPVGYSSAALGVFGEDLPLELAEKVNDFYGECMANGLDVCMTPENITKVAKLWQPVAGCTQSLQGEETKEAAEKRELSCRLNQLINNFSFVEKKVTDKKDKLELRRSIAPFQDGLPETPRTADDYKIAINKYRGMVQLALQLVHGDWPKPEEGWVPNRMKPRWGLRND